MTKPGGSLAPRLQILAAALLFSTGGAAIKATSLGSWQVASLRSGVAAVVLFLLLPAARRRWTLGTLAVGLAYAATLILFVLANKLTTAASTIFLQSTAPLYVVALAPRWLGESFRRRDLLYMLGFAAGLGLCFAGVDPASATAPAPFEGNLLGAAAGVTWALTILGLRQLGRAEEQGGTSSAAAAALVGNLLAFAAALPWALPLVDVGTRTAGGSGFGALGSGVLGLADLGAVLYLGAFQVGLAYVALTRGIRRVPALEASLLLLLEPVVSPVWAWWVHGERPGPWCLAGGALILGVTLAKTWHDSRTARRSARGAPHP